MEQESSSRLGKEYVKAVYCHPAYLTNMQSTSCIILDWIKHEAHAGIKITRRNISNLRYADDNHPYDTKQRGTEEPLDESERGEWESWFKA